jgi:magnesium-transporting ATPase (P-type)
LTALMILFINLITGELPSLGLCVDKPHDDIMKQKPRDPKESILSDYLLLKIAEIVPLVVLGAIILYIYELVKGASITTAQTVAFATIIFCELFHVFNAVAWDDSVFSKKIFSNLYVIGGVLIASLATFFVIYYPPMQLIFGTTSIGISEWLKILGVSVIGVLFVELQKTILQAEIHERSKYQIYPTRVQ